MIIKINLKDVVSHLSRVPLEPERGCLWYPRPVRQCFISYVITCCTYGYRELFYEALKINKKRITDEIVIYAAIVGGSEEIVKYLYLRLNSYKRDLAVYLSVKYNHPNIYTILSENKIIKGDYLKNICIIPGRPWLPPY
jgi:hypothetical protein